MFKKLFLTIITICILSIPILGNAVNIELPYKSRDGATTYTSIRLPTTIMEDFSKWSYTRTALTSDKDFPITGFVNSTICKLTFTNNTTTTYILYVYCKYPLVVGLQKINKIAILDILFTFKSFWKYIDKKPMHVLMKREFYHFLALLNEDLP